jgi:hypothetical protein
VPNSRKPPKKVSKAGKKPAKRPTPKTRNGVGRKASNTQKQNRNKELLAGDIAFYNTSEKKNYGRRTKGNAEHPRGVPLYTLRPNGKGFMISNDGSIRLTEQAYEKLALNPDAIPKYTPIHKDGKIVRFRNTKTGDIVTPYYRYKIFGKTFNEIQDEETRIRSTLYVESQQQQRHARLSRHYSLAQSYQILHPEMNLNQIVASPDFQRLVAELTTFNYKLYGINLENIEIAQSAGYNINMEDAKRALGSNPEYQEVLVKLGRRKPSDNHPVGDSDPNYIKNVVEPYYEAREE